MTKRSEAIREDVDFPESSHHSPEGDVDERDSQGGTASEEVSLEKDPTASEEVSREREENFLKVLFATREGLSPTEHEARVLSGTRMRPPNFES